GRAFGEEYAVRHRDLAERDREDRLAVLMQPVQVDDPPAAAHVGFQFDYVAALGERARGDQEVLIRPRARLQASRDRHDDDNFDPATGRTAGGDDAEQRVRG